jgi:putative Holliday junction resolvase
MWAMPENDMTVMGFDFGMRHIGIAVGQTITRTAEALTSISAQQGIPDWKQIEKLIAEWKPDALVVGLPLQMDDSEQTVTRHARRFAQKLKQRFHLPVYDEDERLTTVEAREKLFSQGGYRALTKKAIDSMAAKLILESWLQHS